MRGEVTPRCRQSLHGTALWSGRSSPPAWRGTCG